MLIALEPKLHFTNSISFGTDSVRVWILTGPNRGGKRTYTRAVSQISLLAQAALPLPASTARLRPVTAIFNHFAAPETAALEMRRLDEEMARLAEIFQSAMPTSLILLNEVLAGTSTIEALGLAVDAIRGLRLLGARDLPLIRVGEVIGWSAGRGILDPTPDEHAVELGDDPRRPDRDEGAKLRGLLKLAA